MTPERLLAFEAAHPSPFGPEKNELIRRQLGISPERYVVLLQRAARSTVGIAADPITARVVRERSAADRDRRLARLAHTLPTVDAA